MGDKSKRISGNTTDDEDSKKVFKKNDQFDKISVLSKIRHFEKIEPYKIEAQQWLPKERMKTVSVALVLCLNLPVDPPDIVKPRPCARLEAWVDPAPKSPPIALRTIGNSLQSAYEKWQPKARYKQSLDPTIDDIKKVCTSLRRNAKEERVLFHYNGHGVPKPTANGEIWVFNSQYTQYIPLSIFELQTWMGTPSIYVYDCSNAGIVVQCDPHTDNTKDNNKMSNSNESNMKNSGSSTSNGDSSNHSNGISTPNINCPTSHINQCIQLAACGPSEILPMQPDLPADIFTACLTTPITMAVRWHILQDKGKHISGLNLDIADKIPGQANDRRTVFGELNWIFTAITDTIAWNTLPRELFQRLFRQDLLVASLFRNFLLAERIMRSYKCTPVSCPKLPATHQHHMWDAWDLALEQCLMNLLETLRKQKEDIIPATITVMSPFFPDQLTAFQVWLNLGDVNRSPPEQLPIVLQVLLSQVYRPRALELLGGFLALGPWAVNLVLNVGIFPYILKLLQSTARELKPLLIYLWAKILAVDPNCRNDLIRENAFKYFIPVLSDDSMPSEHKTMSAFVLSVMVTEHAEGQRQALRGSLQSLCLEQLSDKHPPLRQWLVICLGKSWHYYPDARWSATRNLAHEKLYEYLEDPVPEVRAAAAYALGTFISSLPISESVLDQARTINHTITVTLANLVSIEASPLVRNEFLSAMQFLTIIHESAFINAAKRASANDMFSSMSSLNLSTVSGSTTNSLTRVKTPSKVAPMQNTLLSPDRNYSKNTISSPAALTKTTSLHSLNSIGNSSFSGVISLSYDGMYMRLWQIFMELQKDPFPAVAEMADILVEQILNKVKTHSNKDLNDSRNESIPESLTSRSDSPKLPSSEGSTPTKSITRINYDSSDLNYPKNILKTKFVEWSAKSFIVPSKLREPVVPDPPPSWLNPDRQNTSRFLDADTEKRLIGSSKLEDQVFIHKNNGCPSVLLFHPVHPNLIVAEKKTVTIWDLEQRIATCKWSNRNINSTISSIAILNPNMPQTYVACGSGDGAVRIWRDGLHSNKTNSYSSTVGQIESEKIPSPTLVTAFQAMKEISPSTRDTGLLMSWEQRQHTLVVGGDSNIIRLWDLEQERKIFEYEIDIAKANNNVTSIHSKDNLPWIVTGSADGYLRLLDRRISKPIVQQWRDQTSWIVSAELFDSTALSTKIIYGGYSGEVRLYDVRQSSSVQICQANQPITTMATHQSSHLLALGSVQAVDIYHASGSIQSTIRYYDGFIKQKIAPIGCLAFHPSRILLAAGTTDSYVSVYGLKR